MNDHELTTLLKEPFADVHMTVPLDEVVHHGREVRRRRRRRGLTGAVALAGGAVAAVALLVPGGQAAPGGQAGPGAGDHPAPARLAAWTVTRDPDRGITITVNQLKDPAGLQATLRADGIPARVTFDPVRAMTQPLPAGCAAPAMSAAANAQLQDKILTPPAIVAYQQQQRLRPATVRMTYTLNGHVQHITLIASPGWLRELQELRAEHAQYIQVSESGRPMPLLLQTLYEKEEEDAAGRGALYLNPATIPAGIGLSIGVGVVSPSSFGYGVDLVVTSPRCTGS